MSTSATVELAVGIVTSYVSHNSVPTSGLPDLIEQVHSALTGLGKIEAEPEPEPLKPAVSIRRSVTPDFIICLEDGIHFKSLKRHLRSKYDMTPQEYRAKWGLPDTYPMVAPNYAQARSELARTMGLGQQRRLPKPEPEPAPKRSRARKSPPATPAPVAPIAEAASEAAALDAAPVTDTRPTSE